MLPLSGRTRIGFGFAAMLPHFFHLHPAGQIWSNKTAGAATGHPGESAGVTAGDDPGQCEC